MAKVKVLRVIARMNVGGPAFLIKELMVGLDESLIDQVLVYGVCEGKETEITGVSAFGKTHQLPTLRRSVNLLADLRSLNALRKLIKIEKPDLIDTHTFKAGFLIRTLYLFSIKKSVKITHHFHGHLLNGYFSKKTLFLYRRIETILAKKADVLITDGDSITRDLVMNKIAALDKFLSITPGVAKPPSIGVGSDKLRESALKDPRPVVAFIGRLAPIKRPDRFLRIVEELTSRNVKCDFIMYGEGELFSEVQKQIIEREIRVNLFPFEPDIYQIFSNVDILLMTSDNEGTPLTVMESSFAGVPCVGTDVGSMKEIVKNGVNGFLVVPNVELLADKIEELVRDTPALLSLKQTSKTYAEDHFNVRDYVVAHQNLYLSLVRSGKASLR
jgi:glycosyltransferase involved in cell wall biosynthesis